MLCWGSFGLGNFGAAIAKRQPIARIRATVEDQVPNSSALAGVLPGGDWAEDYLFTHTSYGWVNR